MKTDDMLCAIREFTADGVNVGRCYHFVGRGTVRTCPRHGNVTEVQRRYRETGKLTDDNPKGADCGN